MVLMESRGANGNLVVYDYRPEREDAPVGTVAVNRLTGERVLISQSTADPHRIYAGHAWRRIERMIEENDFPEKAMAAWW